MRIPAFFLLFQLVAFILVSRVTTSDADDQKLYDYIVVGAGSAGAVVASRLTENGSISVLLLEAGTDNHPLTYLLSEMPSGAVLLQGRFAFDWKYPTVPQTTACLNNTEQRCLFTSGKALGGSSRINDMLYVRGNRRDFDRWSDLGNPGWSYDEVLPYFLKSEDQTNYDLTKTKYHKAGGLLTVSYNSHKSPFVGPYLQSAVDKGFVILDINGASQMGFSPIQGTVRNGRRLDTAKAFLRPFSSRRNLHIVQGAFVQKILFDEQKAAYGVEYVKDGRKHTAKCSREVILSAGALRSPQLLMVSGVGPEDQLKQFNIEPVAILPGVGENLMDHPATIIWITSEHDLSLVTYRDIVNLLSLIVPFFQWLFFGTGVLTMVNSVEATGFFKTSPQLVDTPDWPDGQMAFATPPFNDTLVLVSYIVQPMSRGTVRLSSDDATVFPAIDPNYFSHPDDMKALISVTRQAFQLANTATFKGMGFSDIDKEARPLCDPNIVVSDYSSDENLECVARRYTFMTYHFSGTCKMGPDSDPMAVVDAELRVRNVQRLRVVDASIMPYVTCGNTNAPTIMIAEKASDMIKTAQLRQYR